MENNLNSYYPGSLAEIVSRPSTLTLELFRYWFSGSISIGKSMELLGLPCNKKNISILEDLNGEMVINLKREEEILYFKTPFRYNFNREYTQPPEVILSLRNISSLEHLINFYKILRFQIKIFIKKDYALNEAKKLNSFIVIDDLPENSADLIKYMGVRIWPYVLSIGYICEYYSSYLKARDGDKYLKNLHSVENSLKKNDWFYKSLTELNEVNSGLKNKNKFIKEYGIRADRDFEITEKRWGEEKFSINMNPKIFKDELKYKQLEVAGLSPVYLILKELILIRSDAKRKSLISFNELRKAVIKEFGINRLNELSLLEIMEGKSVRRPKSQSKKDNNQVIENINTKENRSEGKGLGVSIGNVKGKVVVVKDLNTKLNKNNIAIFPNSGISYSRLYDKCGGIIFVTGGLMTHGAIVSREFNIPAIVDKHARNLRNGEYIEMSGTEGTWKVIKQNNP
jgi:phosphohistidine swiveling domain-containing protein